MRNTQCTAWSASGEPPRVQGAETLYRVRSGTASQKAKAVNVSYNRLAPREGRPSPLERLRSSWIFELSPSSITCPFCSVFTNHTIRNAGNSDQTFPSPECRATRDYLGPRLNCHRARCHTPAESAKRQLHVSFVAVELVLESQLCVSRSCRCFSEVVSGLYAVHRA